MKYRIHFWHGKDENSRCFKRISSICKCVDDEQYIFEGTLSDFDECYDGNFIYIKSGNNEELPLIGVIQHFWS